MIQGAVMKKSPEYLRRIYYIDKAQVYNEMHVDNYEHSTALIYLAVFIPAFQISNLLDIGTGTGRVVKHFVESNLTVIGIEPVKALLEQAR